MKNTITLQIFIGFTLLISSCLGLLKFPSSYVQIPESGLTLYMEFNEANSSVLLGLDIAQDVDYFAVGFADRGNYGMDAFDIVSVVYAPNKDPENTYTVTISDLYSTEKRRPPTDESLNGTSDYFLVDSYAAPGRRQALFVRAIDTKDKYDYNLDPSQTRYGVVINWAWLNKGQGKFGYHGSNSRGTVIAPLYNGFQGKAESYTPGGFWTPAMMFALHGYIMLFGWGLLADVAVQIARYGKSNRFYMTIHSCIMTLLYTLTGAASGVALYLNWGTITGTLAMLHYIGGVIIFILLTLQAAFGLFLGIKITREKLTKTIPSLSKSHAIGGVLLYVLTKAQLALGLYMYKQSFMPYLLTYYVILFTFRAAQEYRFQKKDPVGTGNHKIAFLEDSSNEIHRKLMTLLNNNTPVHEILQDPELKDLKWAVFEDKVFTINKFDHPGGNFILNEINGQEISRFIYGAYGLFYPPNFTQHAHTKQALEIMEKNFIGTIRNGQNVLLAKDEAEASTLGKEQNLNPSFDASEIKAKLVPVNGGNAGSNWALANKKQITSHLAKFEFKSKDYQISSSLHDIRHLGRHMKISHSSLPKHRLYTLVLSQTDYRIKRRDLLWKRVVKRNSSLVDFTNMAPCETLPLIIKNYNLPNAFSTLIHHSPVGEGGFSIEGPYGHGFGLSPESTGLHVIFAAGTGILPFIDLFDYLLESLLDESSHAKNLFKNGFKLHVYASFMNLADFVGLDICEKLSEVCAQNGFNDAFKLTVKAPNAQTSEFFKITNNEFNANFIKSDLDWTCKRVYICGPPKFNESIPQELKVNGYPSENIVLV